MIASRLVFVIATLVFCITNTVIAQEQLLPQPRYRITDSLDDLNEIKEPIESNQLPTESQTIDSPANRSVADSGMTQLTPGIPAWDSASPKPMINVTWASANSSYRRLYFEEKLLERQGLTDGHVRSVLRSSAHFFSRAIAYPFTSRKYWPDEFQSPYALGRPGSLFDK